jgi:hypothetical protein
VATPQGPQSQIGFFYPQFSDPTVFWCRHFEPVLQG